MRKSVIAASIAVAFAAPGLARAQQPAPPAEAKSPHTVTGNLTLITDYRFRGISQTNNDPTIQGSLGAVIAALLAAIATLVAPLISK